jgi:hypothetical protein
MLNIVQRYRLSSSLVLDGRIRSYQALKAARRAAMLASAWNTPQADMELICSDCSDCSQMRARVLGVNQASENQFFASTSVKVTSDKRTLLSGILFNALNIRNA